MHGCRFHFDEIGDYNMLWEASGLKVGQQQHPALVPNGVAALR